MTARIVSVVGIGALGSYTGHLLHNADISIRAIDHDRIERRNLDTQLHSSLHIGKNKAVAMADAFRAYRAPVRAFPTKLTPANAAQLLGGSHLILDACDNAPARHAAQDYATAHAIPCLHGGLAADGGYGAVLWDTAFRIDDAPPGARTCDGAQNVAFIAGVAAWMAQCALEFLETGRKVGASVSKSGVIRI